MGSIERTRRGVVKVRGRAVITSSSCGHNEFFFVLGYAPLPCILRGPSVSTPPDHDETAFRLMPERLAIQVEGQDVVLTATQFRILAVLMGEPGRVFSREELVRRAFAKLVSGRTVDVHIKELRRKLASHEWRIQTVRGQGYRFQETPSARGRVDPRTSQEPAGP
jgi:DNA-binding response OmpR family regulator